MESEPGLDREGVAVELRTEGLWACGQAHESVCVVGRRGLIG